MTFEEWWPEPEVPMPTWFASLRAGFRACWIQATGEAAKQERERCANKCDEICDKWTKIAHRDNSNFADGIADGGYKCATAIRESAE